MNLPLGFRYAATYAGIRKIAERRSGADCFGHAGGGRGGVHAESRGGGAGGSGAQESAGFARQGFGDPGERRQCQLRHAHRRAGGASDCQRGRQGAGRPSRKRCCRLDRRDRRRNGRRKSRRRRCPDLVAGLDAARFEAVAASDHDHRSVPKTAFAEIKSGARSRNRRHDQRLRHDPAQHGDDAGLRRDGRGGLAGGAALGTEACDRAQLQPHFGGWRHFDQRHGGGARERRVRREAAGQSLRGGAHRACWNRWRSRSRATAKARGSCHHRRGRRGEREGRGEDRAQRSPIRRW